LSIESAAFAIGVAKTMFAALYGELVLHPRPDPLAELSEDAYSLFYARSAAMGWLAAFLADLSSRHGVSTPLILTADR